MTDHSELKSLLAQLVELDCTQCVLDIKDAQALIAENEALREIATELRRWASCEHVHHDKLDQHEFDEPCKVLARIDKVLSKEG